MIYPLTRVLQFCLDGFASWQNCGYTPAILNDYSSNDLSINKKQRHLTG